MRNYLALAALIIAACFIMSMPVMAEKYTEYKNKVNLSANITAGNIASDVTITSKGPFYYSISAYPSTVVYNPTTGKVANYDGYGATDSLILKKGDVVYDSLAEEIIFTDDADSINVISKILNGNGSDRIGALQLFYYPVEAPSIEVFAAAMREAFKTIGPYRFEEFGSGDFAGYPGVAWKIINPANNRYCVTGFVRLNDHAIQAYTAEWDSYSQMDTKMRYWGV